MHAIPNHRNSNFQIIHFLAGSCHTPDGAFALLCNLKEEREAALAFARVGELRAAAKTLRAKELKDKAKNNIERLEAEADLEEIESSKVLTKKSVAACERELGFIEIAIVKLQPHRKYKCLPDHEAHQAAQRAEWKFELIRRVENFLLTQGTIPADHFETMRQHPDYASELVPTIVGLTHALEQGGRNKMLMAITDTEFDLPKLLGDK